MNLPKMSIEIKLKHRIHFKNNIGLFYFTMLNYIILYKDDIIVYWYLKERKRYLSSCLPYFNPTLYIQAVFHLIQIFRKIKLKFMFND